MHRSSFILYKKSLSGTTSLSRSNIAFSVICWLIFAVLAILFLKPFVNASASSPDAVVYGLDYGYNVCIGSIGLFTESTFTKILQAGGDMRRPMAASSFS